MADEIKTERVSITIRGKKGRRTARAVQTKGPRYGPFTRPVDDDPISVGPPVLLMAGAFDFEVYAQAYDLTNPAAPKAPKRVASTMQRMTARNKTIAFPAAQGYVMTFDGMDFKLETLKLSNPLKPVSTASLVLAAPIRTTVLEEGLLYWTDPFAQTIAVADVSSPSALSIIQTYSTVGGFADDQTFMGIPTVLNNRLYVASAQSFGGVAGSGDEAHDSFVTYDFTVPSAAVQVNVISLNAVVGSVVGGVAAQRPPTVLGDGVVYVGFMQNNSPATTYTTKLLTFSIASPDAPTLVNSLVVATDPGPVVGFAIPGYAPKLLFINKSKTRLFLQTHPSPPIGDFIGALWMFDISVPAAPVFLDSISFTVSNYDAEMRVYASDTGYVYVGDSITGLCAIYKYSDGVFELVNTLEVAADPMVALDKKGFPQ